MKSQKLRGFTIIELMIVVTLLGVITALAAPSFAGFLERQRVMTQSELISSMLRTARSEAVSRLVNVDFCWNNSAAAANPNGYALASGQMALLVGSEAIRDIAISGDGLFIDDNDNNDCVTFLPSGRFDLRSTSDGTLVFGVCKESGDTSDSLGIVINAVGRPSTVKNSGGSVIDCT